MTERDSRRPPAGTFVPRATARRDCRAVRPGGGLGAVTQTVAPTTTPATEHPDAVVARAQDATKVYGTGDTAVRALDHVDVAFTAGEFAAVMGPSGSGKSTLLHCLAGLDVLTSGRVELAGRDLAGLGDRAMTVLRRDHVGFVFQTFNLIPTLTAEENILLPLLLGGRRPDRSWFDELTTSLELQGRLGHRPSELSGGQQQRVAMARALITRPDLLFADEPTGNLDSVSATELLERMRSAVDRLGQTVVMVTHDPRAAAYADRVLFLADGKVVRELRAPTTDSVLDVIRTLSEA